jgi:DNA uptake protein ComE-like DNA-binding protein
MHTRVLCSALALALLSVPAFAQDMKPGPSSTTPSVTGTPLTAPKPSTTGAATAPVAAKVNLNTATVAELEKLPRMSPVQAKAIVEARAKSKFKDWNDFAARKVVPADSATAIKEVVTF